MAKTCAICGSTQLVKSHLLPRALAHDLRGNGKNFSIGIAHTPGKIISQAGTADYFLCRLHEAAQRGGSANGGKYEDYAINFIRRFELTDAEIFARAFRRDGTNNDALIRFVCCVLWRYHQSDQHGAEHINLSEWEPNMRDVTFGGSINQAPDVLMCAMHQTLIPQRGFDGFLLTPAEAPQWRRRAIMFSVNGLTFVTKLDHDDWPIDIQRAVLNQTPDWIASHVFYWGEREWRSMKLAMDIVTMPSKA